MSANGHETKRGTNERFRSRSLGEIESAGSRHMWARSAVHVDGSLVVTGTWDGTVTAYDRRSLEVRWTTSRPDHPARIETLQRPNGTSVIVGGRGQRGRVAAYDADSGTERWRYDAADEVGDPVGTGVFVLPHVVALEADRDGRLYAVARRYERDGETRRWESAVYAFAPDGTVRWRYETDASPIAIDLDTDAGATGADRVAVAYNRCPGRHDNGLVVLEAETGDPVWTWDPGTDGERRVGDVSVDGETAAVASHGDRRGYLLGPGGAERWRIDLGVETDVGEETLYAYPNHASLSGGIVAFATGNTYAVDRRETAGRHPNEHRLVAVDAETGEARWGADLGGFARELAVDADTGTIGVPCAQHFRDRDTGTHAVRWFDRESGDGGHTSLEGIATAAAVDDGTIAVIEEPITYHDADELEGEYAVLVGSIG
ncbi:outer membrane protein assembly factor BamB family protein [Halobiforma nitratireducens]|uniref:Pyrrolo-quinoline quinone repeat-containing protein n=1 Tax=Halobiforma nitratireducens JCM 10879 TaxID=1227454 RepID=M0MA22_9EURY|nr:PQQ-binding-like beta-propeller repeat protein [Halobiforma nitratireducens]EMA42586.1 Pyrrolo-quinoline quinone repeat-containing protein [Halobiforma nitratireducens JCM 10879]